MSDSKRSTAMEALLELPEVKAASLEVWKVAKNGSYGHDALKTEEAYYRALVEVGPNAVPMLFEVLQKGMPRGGVEWRCYVTPAILEAVIKEIIEKNPDSPVSLAMVPIFAKYCTDYSKFYSSNEWYPPNFQDSLVSIGIPALPALICEVENSNENGPVYAIWGIASKYGIEHPDIAKAMDAMEKALGGNTLGNRIPNSKSIAVASVFGWMSREYPEHPLITGRISTLVSAFERWHGAEGCDPRHAAEDMARAIVNIAVANPGKRGEIEKCFSYGKTYGAYTRMLSAEFAKAPRTSDDVKTFPNRPAVPAANAGKAAAVAKTGQ